MKASQIQVVFTTVVSDKITTFTESYHSSHLIHFGGLVLAHFPYIIISSNTIQKNANLHLLICHLSFNIPTKYPYILSTFQDLTYYEVQPTQYPYILSYFQILKLDGNRYQPFKNLSSPLFSLSYTPKQYQYMYQTSNETEIFGRLMNRSKSVVVSLCYQ